MNKSFLIDHQIFCIERSILCSIQNKKTSSLVQHVIPTGQLINFVGTRVLANIERYHSRTTREAIREAIEIEKQPHSLNKGFFPNDETKKPVAVEKPKVVSNKNTINQNTPKGEEKK